jgi:glucose-6-phosphate isomerase
MSITTNKQKISKLLVAQCKAMKGIHMRDMFGHDEKRAAKFSKQFANLHIDYSKNLISTDILNLLIEYAETLDIDASIKAMFDGEKINTSENRAVLHTALRSEISQKLIVDDVDVIKQVHTELEKIGQFVNNFHSGAVKGWTDKPIDTFVNIGVGGSDLGAKLVVDALSEFHIPNIRSYFISNIDYQVIDDLKKTIDPETTLFIVSSKSFNTLETKTNAETLKNWLQETGCKEINKQFVAISSNLQATKEFGISPENVFQIWDWVGGRFSLWSAIGLPIALTVGFDNFKSLLTGAREMDEHFKQTSLENNIPVILALIDYWYSNYFEAETHAFIPYDESLKFFPDYLSQLFMESNGKSTSLSGHKLDDETMPITWGAIGTNSQHAFFQLIHQGTHLIPIEFLAPLSKKGNQEHHRLLLANCFAQSQALMQGESNTDPHKHFDGNKPSTTILYSELTPKTLGSLLSMYEHRTFVQGLLWEINSFDQWGVELGKKLASIIYSSLDTKKIDGEMDSSTKNLIELYHKTQ